CRWPGQPCGRWRTSSPADAAKVASATPAYDERVLQGALQGDGIRMKGNGSKALSAIKPAWVLAAVMVLLGLWFAWSAWQAHQTEALAGRTEQMRSQVAGQVGLALQGAVA